MTSGVPLTVEKEIEELQQKTRFFKNFVVSWSPAYDENMIFNFSICGYQIFH